MTGPQNEIVDVLIVGGGPAGLGAALMLGRACRRVVVIDAGHPRNAAARQIHGFLGHDGIGPADLRSAGRREIEAYGVRVVEGEVVQITRLERTAEQVFATAFAIETRDGERFRGRKLLLATGMRDELPELAGIRECYGATIHHCPYCDGWEHRGKAIVVCGSEVKETVGLALAVRGWSSDVTVLTNGLRVDEEQAERMQKNGIAWKEEKIVRIVHRHEHIEGVELAHGATVPAAAMFVRTHQKPGCDLGICVGLERAGPFSGSTDRKQKCDIPGVFLAGDADGEVEFAIVAAGEGATAAVAINRELQEEDQGG